MNTSTGHACPVHFDLDGVDLCNLDSGDPDPDRVSFVQTSYLTVVRMGGTWR